MLKIVSARMHYRPRNIRAHAVVVWMHGTLQSACFLWGPLRLDGIARLLSYTFPLVMSGERGSHEARFFFFQRLFFAISVACSTEFAVIESCWKCPWSVSWPVSRPRTVAITAKYIRQNCFFIKHWATYPLCAHGLPNANTNSYIK